MSNTLITHKDATGIICKEAIMRLENNCVMGNLVYRGYEQEWMQKVNGWKKGDTTTVKAPLYARVKDGETIDVVDYREEDTTLVVDYRKHVARKLTGTEMSLDIDAFSQYYLEPDIQAIGNYIDETLLGLYKYIPNQVGTPGTTPSDFKTLAQASAVMTDHAVPKSDRHLVIDPWASVNIADQMKGTFVSDVANKAIREAAIARMAGWSIYESQNVNTHTCGSAAGITDLDVDGAASEGDTTITIDQGGTLTKGMTQGDIFTVASVNGVNPISGNSTGRLRQFVADGATSTTGNDYAQPCTPGSAPWQIYSASATEKTLPYQNVTALPANNATITVAGSASLEHKVNLGFHKNALGLFMVPVAPLENAKTSVQSYKGFTIRVTMDSDIINYATYIRYDVLFGIKALNPFMACRIAG